MVKQVGMGLMYNLANWKQKIKMTITFKLKGKNSGFPEMAEHFYVLLFNVCAFCTEKINYSYLFNFCLAFCSIRNCYTFSIIIMYFINKTVLPLYDYGRTEWIIQRPLYNNEKKTILTLKSVISNTSLLSFQQFWYASKLCREAKRFCLRAVQPKISMVSASVLSESKST